MEIPIVRLEENNILKETFLEAIGKVIDRNNYILGSEVQLFEESFAKFVQAPFAVGISNGTDAIYVGLKAIGIGPGDEVIVQTNTYSATVAAILLTGAVPVLADIDSETFQISTESIKDAITKKTKAILIVHLYGNMPDMVEITQIAKEHDLAILEDCSQAIGSVQKGKKAGTFGAVGAYSLYPTKVLGAIGDAGILVTANSDIEKIARKLINQGESSKFNVELLGSNMRLDTVQAAILNIKLKMLDRWIDQRNKIGDYYRKTITNPKIRPMKVTKGTIMSQYSFPVIVKDRNKFQEYMLNNGIGTQVHFPIPCHKQKGFVELVRTAGKLEVAEEVSTNIVSIPIYPSLTEEETKYIVDKINQY